VNRPRVPITTDAIEAAQRLRNGGLVVIPTETVYGLGADATHVNALERIYAVKGRPVGHPLILHVADTETANHWADMSHPAAQTLALACWPGPLTMLLPRRPSVDDIITGGRDTVGIRVPAHPLTLSLLAQHGGAIAAPSANRFGRVSPTTVAHVLDDIGDILDPERDLILDGGPCDVGVESTIIDLTVDPPQILRPGGIPTEDIERMLGAPTSAPQGPSRASGMMPSHYAPATPMRLVDDRIAAATAAHGINAVVIDRTDDLVDAARHLYDDLRSADQRNADLIIAVMPPPIGLGHALRDRLTRAAAGRDQAHPNQDDSTP
jgi:L-threonylcarbamoyladenylate synthase